MFGFGIGQTLTNNYTTLLRLLRTCSSKNTFESNLINFKERLNNRGYSKTTVNNTLGEIKFDNRSATLKLKPKIQKRILPFITTFNPAAPDIKTIIMENWHIIQSQPKLNSIFPRPPIMSYRKAKSLKDMLVGAEL